MHGEFTRGTGKLREGILSSRREDLFALDGLISWLLERKFG